MIKLLLEHRWKWIVLPKGVKEIFTKVNFKLGLKVWMTGHVLDREKQREVQRCKEISVRCITHKILFNVKSNGWFLALTRWLNKVRVGISKFYWFFTLVISKSYDGCCSCTSHRQSKVGRNGRFCQQCLSSFVVKIKPFIEMTSRVSLLVKNCANDHS